MLGWCTGHATAVPIDSGCLFFSVEKLGQFFFGPERQKNRSKTGLRSCVAYLGPERQIRPIRAIGAGLADLADLRLPAEANYCLLNEAIYAYIRHGRYVRSCDWRR
jgi:hypothetical protein